MSQRRTIEVTIKGTDGLSKTFVAIGKNATTSASQIEQAGRRMTSGLAGVDKNMVKVEQSTKRADASLKGFVATARTMDSAIAGAAIGAAVSGIAKLGAAAETQRRQIAGLQAQYGDAADEIIRFTNAMQGQTTFSNEDARQAASIAATLAQNYGFTAAEIQKLITVSGDLAAIQGLTLADATQRTVAAMRGEAESAEALGLTLNQQAIDREGLTLTMTNEEAAHFRLNALLDQAAFANGKAGESAATAAGQTQQYVNQLQDMAVDAGKALGPVAGVASVLADVALAAPLAGAAIGRLLPLLLGLGPAGLAGGVAIAGLALLAVKVKEYQDAAALAEHPTELLSDAIARLGTESLAATAAMDLASSWEEASGRIETAVAKVTDAEGELAATQNDDYTDEATAQAIQDRTLALQEQIDTNKDLALSEQQRADIQIHLAEIIESGNIRAISAANRMIDTLDDQGVKAAEVAGAIGTLAENADSYGDAANEARGEIAELAATSAEATPLIRDLAFAGSQMATAFREAAQSVSTTRGMVNDAIAASGAGFGAGFGIQDAYGADAEAGRERYGAQLDEQKRRNEELAQAEQDAQNEMAARAREAVSWLEQEQRQTEQIADINERLGETIADAERARSQAVKSIEKDYSQTVKNIERGREQAARETASKLKDIERERVEIAEETASRLADLDQQRADIQTDASERMRDAEADYQSAIQDSAQAQADARKEMAETVKSAADAWHDAQQDALADLRELREEQRRAQNDDMLQYARSIEDLNLGMTRAAQDITTELADPDLTPERRAELELEWARKVEDYNLARRRLNEDAQREEQERTRELRSAQADAAKEKKAAQEDYKNAVADAHQQYKDQVADLRKAQQDAASDLMSAQADIADETQSQLDDLSQQQSDILSDQASQFRDLEMQKRQLLNETARAAEQASQDIGRAERERQRELMGAERDYASAVAEASGDAAEAIADVASAQTDLDLALESGAISLDEYNAAIAMLPDVKAKLDAERDAATRMTVDTLPGFIGKAGEAADATAAIAEKPAGEEPAVWIDRAGEAADDLAAAAKEAVGPIGDAAQAAEDLAGEYIAVISAKKSSDYQSTLTTIQNDMAALEANEVVINAFLDSSPDLGQGMTQGGAGSGFDAGKQLILDEIARLEEQSVAINAFLNSSPDMSGGAVGQGSPNGFAAGVQYIRGEIESLELENVNINAFLNSAPPVAGAPGAKGIASGFTPGADYIRTTVAELDALSATIDVLVDASQLQVLQQIKEQVDGKTLATTYIDVKKRRPTDEDPSEAAEVPTTGGPRNAPTKATGGPAAGWFIAGDPGQHWELIHAPHGASVFSHDESVRMIGGLGGDVPAYAGGRHGKGSGHPDRKPVKNVTVQDFSRWLARQSPEVQAIVAEYTASNPARGELSNGAKMGLMKGTWGVYASGQIAPHSAAPSGYPELSTTPLTRRAGKKKKVAPPPPWTPPTTPPPAPPPVEPVAPIPPPPLTGIGPEPIGDIPVPGASAFGGTSDVTTLLAQSMVAQQAQGEDLRRQVADIRAESSTADLAKAVNALRRTIDRLNTRIETLESTSGTTFNSYGTLYAQGSKDLSGSLDVARQNATALRLGS
jgi:hypothetical protein